MTKEKSYLGLRADHSRYAFQLRSGLPLRYPKAADKRLDCFRLYEGLNSPLMDPVHTFTMPRCRKFTIDDSSALSPPSSSAKHTNRAKLPSGRIQRAASLGQKLSTLSIAGNIAGWTAAARLLHTPSAQHKKLNVPNRNGGRLGGPQYSINA